MQTKPHGVSLQHHPAGGWRGRAASPLERHRARVAYGFILPALLVLAAILAAPIVFSLYVSLHDWTLFGDQPELIGLDNYVRALSDPAVLASFVRTALFVLITVGAQTVLGFGIALFLFREFGRLRLLGIVLLLPMMISEVVAGLGFRLILSHDVSLLNWLLGLVGIEPQVWLGSDWAFISVMAVDVWQHTPFVILVLFAAMQGLPQDVLEAAKVDGATGFTSVRHIMLPLLMPALLVVVMFRTVFAMRVFTPIYILTGGGPADSTTLLGIEIYRAAFQHYEMGYAAALSALMLLFSMAVGVLYIKLLSREALS
ncbi:sugar ABC transporter permease [Actinobacteria bacterium YIM 96077]|uniref:Sugar ABC transporter permease n=1 Tax=Phytoactinopolyspora halophila TaxID=1981511 RepID=A0A329QA82_9ACTN|nr:sugar ABC transporter permease [Phytoactinopolyspora halophila]AYY12483.1 sugar ABC transporter permease [Actinobacteria bacterium YIM 96077]RAW09320.1 sugar ABC transporter permease [Phytoactinopolyspora halophila]